MKVLLLNNKYPSAKKPHQATYIKTIHDLLKDGGYQVSLLVLKDITFGKLGNLISYLCFLCRLILFRHYSKYDIIYIHHATYVAIPFLFYMPFSLDKVVLHWHGEDLFPNKRWVQNIAKKALLKFKYARHITPSNYYAKKLATSLNVDVKSILVSPSGGVDIETFKPIALKSRSLEIIRLGFASGVTEDKGYDIIKLILKQILKLSELANVKIELLVIEYGVKLNSFKEWLKDNNLEENVVFCGPFPKSKMVDYYNEIDILLFPTRRETESLGLVALEAMACNVPILGPKDFALVEYTVPGVSGELYNPKDSEDAINNLELLIRNLGKYEPRKIIVDQYSEPSVRNWYIENFI